MKNPKYLLTSSGRRQAPRMVWACCLILSVWSLPLGAYGQSGGSDMGIWTEIGVEKKVNKKVSLGLDAELRTDNDASRASRWAVGVDGDYKFSKWLKGSVGYNFLYDRRDKYTYHADGSLNKYARYWTPRHRFHADLTGSWNLGQWELSLRERWQYTYRPEHTISGRYDYDQEAFDNEPKTYSGTGKHVLRSRLQVSRALGKWEPYANIELYNGWALEKVRYTAGIDLGLTKHHKLGAYYRFQTTHNDSDEEPDMHILGVSYKYKF